MCHQSVGLIARQLEAAGFPTIGLSSARSITAAANPPRSVFVDLPLGHTAGPPHDRARQREIVLAALERGVAMTAPSIVDLDLRWHQDDWKADPLGWSRRSEDERDRASAGSDSGLDSRTPRRPEAQYQTDDDRRAAESTDWDDQCLVCLGVAPPG